MEFKWHSEQQSAFDKLKELITITSALAHVDVNRKTRILVDVSPVGLGEVLIQLQRVEWRVIAYASRGLTVVERRYSQTEREALSLVWACERFNRDLKQPRRRAEWTPAGSVLTKPATSAHVSDVVHMAFRT